jgi:hypothetical protein
MTGSICWKNPLTPSPSEGVSAVSCREKILKFERKEIGRNKKYAGKLKSKRVKYAQGGKIGGKFVRLK